MKQLQAANNVDDGVARPVAGARARIRALRECQEWKRRHWGRRAQAPPASDVIPQDFLQRRTTEQLTHAAVRNFHTPPLNSRLQPQASFFFPFSSICPPFSRDLHQQWLRTVPPRPCPTPLPTCTGATTAEVNPLPGLSL